MLSDYNGNPLKFGLFLVCLSIVGIVGCTDPQLQLQFSPSSQPVGQNLCAIVLRHQRKGWEELADASISFSRIQPSEQVFPAGNCLSFEKSGDYDIEADVGWRNKTFRVDTSLTIHPAAPAELKLEIYPEQPRCGDQVVILPYLIDQFGNRSPETGAIELSFDPPDDVFESADGWIFTSAGIRSIEARDPSRGLETHSDLELLPSDPAQSTFYVSNNRLRPGQAISATLEIQDAYGNAIDLEPSLEVIPDESVSIRGEEIRFYEEGRFSVVAQAGDFSGEATVVVDGTGPLISVNYPPRAEFLSDAPLTVQGTIEDSVAGIAHFSINGQTPTLRGSNFWLELTPARGTQVFEFQATDWNDNSSSWVQAALCSPQFNPVETFLPRGLVGRLNQPTIDLLEEELEFWLESDELEQEILAANPIYSYADSILSVTVDVQTFSYEFSSVEFVPRYDSNNGYLQIQIDFYNVDAVLTALIDYGISTSTVIGTLAASSVSAVGEARVAVRDGTSDVTLEDVEVSILGFAIELNSDLLEYILDLMSDAIAEELEQLLEDYIYEEVPDFLEAYLDYLNVSETIALNNGDISTDLSIVTRLDSVEIDEAGLTLKESTMILASPTTDRINHPGYPVMGAGNVAYAAEPGYFLSASLDALNSALYAVWVGGILVYSYETTLDSGENVVAKLDLPLPALFEPSKTDDYLVDATVGDMSLDLYVDSGSPTYRLAVSLNVPTTVHADAAGTSLSLEFGTPTLQFQILDAPTPALPEETIDLLLDEILNQALLEVELAAQEILVPTFAGYQMTITQLEQLGNDFGYLMVGGDLQRVTVP